MMIDMTRVRAVVFDLGGVLIEVDPERCFRFWSEHSTSTAESLRPRFVIDEPYERHERGEIEFSEYAAHLRRRFAIELDDSLMREGWNALLGDALPGAVDAIAQASRRYPCFLFSNSNAVHQATWSEAQRELLAPLRGQFVSSDLGLRKPELPAYKKVAKLAGFAPGELMYFDDLEQNVTAARRAGLQAIQVDGPEDILAIINRDRAR